MPNAPKVSGVAKLFGLLVISAFLGAILAEGLHVLVNPLPVPEPEPVVQEGFDPNTVKPTMGN